MKLLDFYWFCFLLFYRETMLQALRGVLLSVGNKMGEVVRTNLTSTLLAFQGHDEVSPKDKWLY